jgi:hypothetical protein
MSLADPKVFHTFHDDGSADFTLTLADDDHKFSVSGADDGDYAVVTYEETLSWRGQIRVSKPDESVWKILMSSDKMTEYLEQNDLNGVRRKR